MAKNRRVLADTPLPAQKCWLTSRAAVARDPPGGRPADRRAVSLCPDRVGGVIASQVASVDKIAQGTLSCGNPCPATLTLWTEDSLVEFADNLRKRADLDAMVNASRLACCATLFIFSLSPANGLEIAKLLRLGSSLEHALNSA